MSWNVFNANATIFKTDKGAYKASIMSKEIDNNGEEKSIFMQINVGFKKGIEVKNKSKINVKEAFLTFFRIPTGNTYEDGTPEYKKFPKIMIMDFEVVEEGVDEVQQTKDYSNTQSNFSDDSIGGFYPSMSDDDLPF